MSLNEIQQYIDSNKNKLGKAYGYFKDKAHGIQRQKNNGHGLFDRQVYGEQQINIIIQGLTKDFKRQIDDYIKRQTDEYKFNILTNFSRSPPPSPRVTAAILEAKAAAVTAEANKTTDGEEAKRLKEEAKRLKEEAKRLKEAEERRQREAAEAKKREEAEAKKREAAEAKKREEERQKREEERKKQEAAEAKKRGEERQKREEERKKRVEEAEAKKRVEEGKKRVEAEVPITREDIENQKIYFNFTTSKKTDSCGGLFIHPQIIITAAHCIKNENNEILKQINNIIIHGKNFKRLKLSDLNKSKYKYIEHDDWDVGNVHAQHDFGIIYFENPPIEGIKEIPIFTDLKKFVNKKAYNRNNASSNLITCNFEFTDPTTKIIYVSGCTLINGDSGSPLFSELNGEWGYLGPLMEQSDAYYKFKSAGVYINWINKKTNITLKTIGEQPVPKLTASDETKLTASDETKLTASDDTKLTASDDTKQKLRVKENTGVPRDSNEKFMSNQCFWISLIDWMKCTKYKNELLQIDYDTINVSKLKSIANSLNVSSNAYPPNLGKKKVNGDNEMLYILDNDTKIHNNAQITDGTYGRLDELAKKMKVFIKVVPYRDNKAILSGDCRRNGLYDPKCQNWGTHGYGYTKQENDKDKLILIVSYGTHFELIIQLHEGKFKYDLNCDYKGEVVTEQSQKYYNDKGELVPWSTLAPSEQKKYQNQQAINTTSLTQSDEKELYDHKDKNTTIHSISYKKKQIAEIDIENDEIHDVILVRNLTIKAYFDELIEEVKENPGDCEDNNSIKDPSIIMAIIDEKKGTEFLALTHWSRINFPELTNKTYNSEKFSKLFLRCKTSGSYWDVAHKDADKDLGLLISLRKAFPPLFNGYVRWGDLHNYLYNKVNKKSYFKDGQTHDYYIVPLIRHQPLPGVLSYKFYIHATEFVDNYINRNNAMRLNLYDPIYERSALHCQNEKAYLYAPIMNDDILMTKNKICPIISEKFRKQAISLQTFGGDAMKLGGALFAFNIKVALIALVIVLLVVLIFIIYKMYKKGFFKLNKQNKVNIGHELSIDSYRNPIEI